MKKMTLGCNLIECATCCHNGHDSGKKYKAIMNSNLLTTLVISLNLVVK